MPRSAISPGMSRSARFDHGRRIPSPDVPRLCGDLSLRDGVGRAHDGRVLRRGSSLADLCVDADRVARLRGPDGGHREDAWRRDGVHLREHVRRRSHGELAQAGRLHCRLRVPGLLAPLSGGAWAVDRGILRADALRAPRHDGDDLGQSPAHALSGPRTDVARALRAHRTEPGLGRVDRGRHEVLRPGRHGWRTGSAVGASRRWS